MNKNVDEKVVSDFGFEWSKFDQSVVSEKELYKLFTRYFSLFPWKNLPENPQGFDMGCGSGRWARFVAPRVSELHCIDPSMDALQVARFTLAEFTNCHFHAVGVDDIPFEDNSMDFGYSLGVLHHIPDTQAGIQSCISKLKPGAPFLLYLYYRFDNRPLWFRLIWKCSDILRHALSRCPQSIKYITSQMIAFAIYFPLAKLARIADQFGFNVEKLPLSDYKDKSLYTMRTDALDRFGTRLEKRFTQDEIRTMLNTAGLVDIEFSEHAPYWCAVGIKTQSRNS